MAKAKAKAAVKRKPAKTQARPAAPKPAAAKPAQKSAAKTAKPAAAKLIAKPAVKVAAREIVKPSKQAEAALPPRSAKQLSLPGTKQVEAVVAKPQPVTRPPVARKPADISARADLPPADGFTLLVDGHFKSSFDDLKGAKAAASELKGRFPMLRVEIYDAAKKARLPA